MLWKDGWPVAGENLKEGTYQFESVRTGTVIELAVEGFPVGGRPTRRGPPPAGFTAQTGGPPGTGGGIFAGIGKPIPTQDVAEVSMKWPTSNVDVRMGNYMCQAQQKWAIEPVADAGGYLGSPYFKISIAGTTRTLAATEGGELVALPDFTGSAEQLWRFDQLADGSCNVPTSLYTPTKVDRVLHDAMKLGWVAPCWWHISLRATRRVAPHGR